MAALIQQVRQPFITKIEHEDRKIPYYHEVQEEGDKKINITVLNHVKSIEDWKTSGITLRSYIHFPHGNPDGEYREECVSLFEHKEFPNCDHIRSILPVKDAKLIQADAQNVFEKTKLNCIQYHLEPLKTAFDEKFKNAKHPSRAIQIEIERQQASIAYGCHYWQCRQAYSQRIYYPSQLSPKKDVPNDRYWHLQRTLEKVNWKYHKPTYKGKSTKRAIRLQRMQLKRLHYENIRWNKIYLPASLQKSFDYHQGDFEKMVTF